MVAVVESCTALLNIYCCGGVVVVVVETRFICVIRQDTFNKDNSLLSCGGGGDISDIGLFLYFISTPALVTNFIRLAIATVIVADYSTTGI